MEEVRTFAVIADAVKQSSSHKIASSFKNLLAMTFFLFFTLPLNAATLKIGTRADVTSMDPHYHISGPNLSAANHLYNALIAQDDKQVPRPSLAKGWRQINDLTWEFILQENVKFHTGETFTGEDVVASIARLKKGVGPINAFTNYTKHIDRVTVIEPYKIQITTNNPYPLLIWDLANLMIIPANAAKLSSEDFNKKSYGTGPYILKGWTPQHHILLTKNPTYWQKNEPWDKVIIKPVPNELTRYHGLRSGDLDVIESLPVHAFDKIKEDKKLKLIAKIPTRLMYLALDSARTKSPFIKGTNANPLRDRRVRKAFSLAINRNHLIQHYLAGYALPAGQLVPPQAVGYVEELKADPYNLEQAKALLKEAGYEKGFTLTLHGTQDRYLNDTKITQALALMLSKLNIRVIPEVLPSSLFFSRAQKSEFTLSLAGWPAVRETLSPLQALLYSYNPKKGTGLFNRGRYSSQLLDALTDKALITMNDEERLRYVQKANQVAIHDYAIIPLYFSMNNWALREDLTFLPRMDEYTFAMNVRAK